MDKKHSIIVCAKEFRGGRGAFLNQIDKISKKIFSIKFLLYKKDKYSYFKSDPLYINEEYPVGTGLSFKKAFIFIESFIHTYSFIRKNKLNIYFLTDLYSSIIVLIIKRLFFKELKLVILVNINLVYLVRNKPNRFYRFLLLKIVKNLYPDNYFIFVSAGLANYTIEQFKLNSQKIFTINSSVDNDSLLSEAKPGDLSVFTNNSNIKVISAGRLDWPKDFKTLVSAFYLISKEIKNVDLFIVGEGKDRKQIENFIKLNRLSSRIKLLGWKKNIHPYLKQSDIFVLSTKSDAFPRVILEAMEAKLPIISSDVDFGPREILDQGKYGLLVKPNDLIDLYNALKLLILNKELRYKYSKLSIKRIKKYNFKSMLKSYEEIFLKILKRDEIVP